MSRRKLGAEAATPSTMPHLLLSLRNSTHSRDLKGALRNSELGRKRGPWLVICSPDGSRSHRVGTAIPGVGASMAFAFLVLLSGHFCSQRGVCLRNSSLLSLFAQPLKAGTVSPQLDTHTHVKYSKGDKLLGF